MGVGVGVGVGFAACTVMFRLAVAEPPRLSATLTVNVFKPELADSGVPDNAPLAETINQVGPLTLAKVNGSLFGSVALTAIDEL